jgi:hypothetical protein
MERSIIVGDVLWMYLDELRRHPRIEHRGGTEDGGKRRPFVCYGIDGQGDCYFAPITTSPREGRRLALEAGWFRNASGDLRALQQYLHDGWHTYRGPREAFLACTNGATERPFLGQPGVEAVCDEVDRCGGLMPE